MRGEALQTLGNWSDPSVYDRVDGRYLGVEERDDSYAIQQLSRVIASLLRDSNPIVQQQAAMAAGQMKIIQAEAELVRLVRASTHPMVRSTALNAIFDLGSENINQALQAAFKDRDPMVRSTALAILPNSQLPEETSIQLFKQIMNTGSYPEQQVVLASLGDMDSQLSVQTLAEYLSWLENGKAKPEIQLDIIEAVNSQGDATLLSSLEEYETAKGDSPLSPFIETLVGGDPERGGEIFRTHEAAQCIRCHTIFETGGTMGPGLAAVGKKYQPEQLLTALIQPSESFAEGYHMVTLSLSNGETLTGLVEAESSEAITIRSGNQQAKEIDKSTIEEQKSIPSSMPPMGSILTKKEIRDVIAFLGTLQEQH
jgi:putative heme-binding domain-containing protein